MIAGALISAFGRAARAYRALRQSKGGDMRFGVCFLVAAMSVGSGLNALTLEDCARTTHVSHGGEADHVDLGEGRVMWRDWWSQEGTATDIWLVDCASGAALTFRSAESNMGSRLPFDRTDKALRILDRHQSGARAFATFERIAADLEGEARDIEISTMTTEPCACAALYGDQRGEKTAFKLKG